MKRDYATTFMLSVHGITVKYASVRTQGQTAKTICVCRHVRGQAPRHAFRRTIGHVFRHVLGVEVII